MNSVHGTCRARFDAVDARIESLERQMPMIQDIADLKASLAVIEKRTSR